MHTIDGADSCGWNWLLGGTGMGGEELGISLGWNCCGNRMGLGGTRVELEWMG